MSQIIGLKASVAVLLFAIAHDARATAIADVSYAANAPCPVGCSSYDGKRLQAAFGSSQTKPHQMQKTLHL